jgi:hypothetical protein
MGRRRDQRRRRRKRLGAEQTQEQIFREIINSTPPRIRSGFNGKQRRGDVVIVSFVGSGVGIEIPMEHLTDGAESTS